MNVKFVGEKHYEIYKLKDYVQGRVVHFITSCHNNGSWQHSCYSRMNVKFLGKEKHSEIYKLKDYMQGIVVPFSTSYKKNGSWQITAALEWW